MSETTAEGTLMLDELYEVIRPFLGPHPLAIWFIDKEAEYRDLIRTAEPTHFAPTHAEFGVPTIFGGLPIYNWSMRIATEEEKARAPQFCLGPPGIWVEMSNGKHYKLTGYPLGKSK